MKTQWKWAIRIFVFCLTAPAVLFTVHIGVRSYAMNSGAVVASRFLEALRSHDYVAAHALMAPSEEAEISVNALQKAQEQIEKKHGLWISSASCNEQHPDDALDCATYFYPMTKDCITYFYSVSSHYDDVLIMVRGIRTDDGWRVLEYHYDYSPA